MEMILSIIAMLIIGIAWSEYRTREKFLPLVDRYQVPMHKMRYLYKYAGRELSKKGIPLNYELFWQEFLPAFFENLSDEDKAYWRSHGKL